MTMTKPDRVTYGAANDGIDLRIPPLRLGPTIVVAIDKRGGEVARRLASLLRANARTNGQAGDAAVRKRFSFLQITSNAQIQGLTTDVQAIRIEPSTHIWDIDLTEWETQPFQVDASQTFGQALDATVKDVLAYTEAREDLRTHNIVVRPSHLNIFFVGSLIEEPTIVIDPLDQRADDATLAHMKSQVQEKLSELSVLAKRALNYATDSANIDAVVRAAFLTLILPDSIEAARQAIQSNGTTLGKLLGAGMQSHEPPLHFCSIHTGHDEDGAWYDPAQLANVLASAIYAFMMSEMLDEQICRQQLGLQELFASPYSRLITVAAMRATFPRAEMLDYAALRYGADLLEQLLPATPPMPSGVRRQVREHADEVFDYNRLRDLVTRPVGNLWDQQGRPSRLSEIAQNANPPDLVEVIPNPRAGFFESWAHFANRSLSDIEKINNLVGYLQELDPSDPQASGYRFVDDQGRPLPLPYAHGSARTFIYSQETLLSQWHNWRSRLDSLIGEDPVETRARLDALRQEIDRTFWGDSAEASSRTGPDYCRALVERIQEQVNELRTMIEGFTLDASPSDNQLNEQLRRAHAQSRARMSLSPIAAVAILVAIASTYFINALRTALGGALIVDFAHSADLIASLPIVEINLLIPFTLFIGALVGIIVLTLGCLVRLAQGLAAVSAIKEYAALVRRRFALQMYRDEQRRLMMMPGHIEDFLTYLHYEMDAHELAVKDSCVEIRHRAARLAEASLRDVTEYVPLAHGGLVALYERTVEPYKHYQLDHDLIELRRFIHEFGSISGAQTTNTDAITAEARSRLHSLVRGNKSVTELDQRAWLRFLAYRAMQQFMDRIAAQSISQETTERAVDLSQRTRLMLNNTQQPNTFEQAYTIVPFTTVAQSVDLAGSIEVRSLDHQMVIFARIVSNVWPRLFEQAEIHLV